MYCHASFNVILLNHSSKVCYLLILLYDSYIIVHYGLVY